MASNTRSTRSTASTNSSSAESPPSSLVPEKTDFSSLSNVERLILSQAVYEHGADAWGTVSQVLSNHPSLTRPVQFFTPQSCQTIYTGLMNEASLECAVANNVPHAPLNLKLAQRHYTARLLELRDLIAAEEVKFKRILAEINEIRSGVWDDKIRAKLSGDFSPAAHPVEEQLPPQDAKLIRPPSPSEGIGQDSPVQPHTDHPLSGEIVESPHLQHVEEPVCSPQGLKSEASDTNVAQNIEPLADDVAVAIHLGGIRSSPSPIDIMEVDPTKEEDIESPIQPDEGQDDAPAEMAEPLPPRSPDESADAEMLLPREGKRKASEADNPDDNARDKKKLREESTSTDIDIQGPEGEPISIQKGHASVSGSVVGSSSRRRGTTSSEQAPHSQTIPTLPNKRFQTVIGMLHSQISQHRNGNIFHNPIKSSEAPDYHEIIKRPMDLKTIKGKVKDGIITNSLEYQRDVYLMFANAMMYNRPESDIYQMAEEMMLESESHINTFRQTEGFVRSTHRS